MGDDFADRDHLLAGELARQAEVSTDTLRHYERKDVLPRPRRGANGYRMYPTGSLERVRLIRRALAVGFTLDELAFILKEHDSGKAPCKEVYRLTEAKLAGIEQQLVALNELRDDLKKTLSGWKKRLSKAAPGIQAKLLESLNGESSRSGKLSPNLKQRGRKS